MVNGGTGGRKEEANLQLLRDGRKRQEEWDLTPTCCKYHYTEETVGPCQACHVCAYCLCATVPLQHALVMCVVWCCVCVNVMPCHSLFLPMALSAICKIEEEGL